ncbi:GGDEF-domain containing protein [Methylobacterium radiotolerans]|uniref:putative bifunctional diguanylate cyclase/phosphodiesterase n=1 Tax=Methylobacterium TaxID=407 RepID=UPI002F31D65C
MGLYAKLRTALAEDALLARDVKRSLVDGLYQPFASLAVGAVSGTIVATAAAFWSDDWTITATAFAVGLIGLTRIALARIYLTQGPKKYDRYEIWERYFSLGAFAYAASLGILSFLITTRSSNLALQVITPTFTIGYAAGISGRNAGRPLLAIAQVLLSAMPLSAGLLVSGDGERASLGILSLLFAYGMIDITLSTREIIVSALVTTREKEALAEKFQAQANLFDIALRNMSHGLCMFDARGRLQVWNDQFVTLSGIPAGRIHTNSTARSLYKLSRAIIDERTARRDSVFSTFSAASNALRSGNLVLILPDNRAVSLMQRRTAERGYVIIFEDITERRRNEARIQQMASYDDLTGLLNRSSFKTKVSQALKASANNKGEFAVHLLDLDHFKVINDTMGHPAGDRLLQLVADRLRGIGPISGSVARLGGDEFVIVQQSVTSPTIAEDLAQRVLQELERPFDIDGHQVTVGASIGIAIAPSHANDEDRLLKCADIALYAIKGAGRSGYKIFQHEMEAATRARHALESDLRAALANGELELHYQPIVDSNSGTVVSCEALLRWRHPVSGYIPPSDFIPVAEDTGLIVQLGNWVLNEACREARRWPQSVSVAVNMSPRQFSDPQLAFHVIGALTRSGLPAHRLELEITESVTLGATHKIVETIDNLRQLGIRLSIDDFGTGYSSLSSLRNFAFDKLKIDRSFVSDLDKKAESTAIIRAIVGMGRSIGMAIVVEGVETETQLAILRAEGCDLIQGYIFSRPIAAPQIRAMLAAAEPLTKLAS